MEREHNDRAWLAYHVAALQRMKKPPRLNTLLIKRKRRQTWQEQFNIMAKMPGVVTQYPERNNG